MVVPPKNGNNGNAEADERFPAGFRTRLLTLRRLPRELTRHNIKTLELRCKDFFLGDQFSLAFDEKKSILRSKKMSPYEPVERLTEARARRWKKIRANHFYP
jgi:hypothetical protein